MPELIDLVNQHGEVMERAVPRIDADHRKELHMHIVIVVVFNGLGKVIVHQRTTTKSVNPGDIDHVCEGILSGETPEVAAVRESEEEIGITPTHLRVVHRGINSYNRYCYLLTGRISEEPEQSRLNPDEVTWAASYYPHELIEANESGKLSFVDGFFEDMELARQR